MNATHLACLFLALCATAIHAQGPASTHPDEQALRKIYPWYQRQLFDESRRDLLETALAGPMKTDSEIVFACRTTIREHWYANFGYFAEGDAQQASVPIQNTQGRLCRLNLRTGQLTVLLDDPDGAVRDPCVHYDGSTILFAYRKKNRACHRRSAIRTETSFGWAHGSSN